MRAEHVAGSTRGPALPYPADVRTSTILASFLFTFAAGIACKDDAPKGAEFGEPCGGDDGCGVIALLDGRVEGADVCGGRQDSGGKQRGAGENPAQGSHGVPGAYA